MKNQLSHLFCSLLSILSILPQPILSQTPIKPAPEPNKIAITFDDLPLNGRQTSVVLQHKMTRRLIHTICANQIAAVGFVNEAQLFQYGEIDRRVELLKLWVDAGLELGNHTYSHPSLHETPVDVFTEDIIRGETVTKMLLKPKQLPLRYFRHPYLRVGQSMETRTQIESFLKHRGYTIAPVTIENSDWMFNALYTPAKLAGNKQDMKSVSEAYLTYTETMFEYYEKLSQDILGRQVRHILLLHANELNADYFDELVSLMKKRGYSFISLEEALADPGYLQTDTYVGKGGISWLHRWAISKGLKPGLLGKPEPPADIQKSFDQLGY
ncbi:MAG TPA: polysaccharide deacetylase family protein [Acidobacteriota bacterium]|nr:polysaccharide deacetylase family protein [Acidobacteriota bacterium]HND19375.1 polysaccharide deacetylase family protein [Acidobacteriota bacterium]